MQHKSPVVHKEPHFVIHVAEGAHKIFDGTEHVSKFISTSAGNRAFRKVTTVKGILEPLMNKSGNLRGQVINYRAKVIYNISADIAKRFEPFAKKLIIAGIIIELSKENDNAMGIIHSNLSPSIKAQKLTLIASTAILRATVTGTASFLTTVVAKSLDGYLQAADLITSGKYHNNLEQARQKIHAADVNINALHEGFTSENVEKKSQQFFDDHYDWINAHIQIK